MKPKNSFFHKNLIKKWFLNQKNQKYPKRLHFFWAKIIVKLMAPAFQKSLKFNHFIINYGRICFPKLDNAISLQQKKPFFTISWHKTIILPYKWPTTMTNNLHHLNWIELVLNLMLLFSKVCCFNFIYQASMLGWWPVLLTSPLPTTLPRLSQVNWVFRKVWWAPPHLWRPVDDSYWPWLTL